MASSDGGINSIADVFRQIHGRHVIALWCEMRVFATDGTGEGIAAILGAQAGTYNVVDDEPLTKRAFADALADAVHTKAWLRPPGEGLAATAKALRLG